MKQTKFRSPSLFAPSVWALVAATALAAAVSDPAPAPRLSRATLIIEPTRRQVATRPPVAAEWRIAPGMAARFERVLAAGGFNGELIADLRARLVIVPETGEGRIRPDAALLDRFGPAERLRWWAILAGHAANRPYRWPLAIRPAALAEISAVGEFAAAAECLRAWGVPGNGYLLYGDVFALEEAFTDADIAGRFWQKLLGVDTVFAKVGASAEDPAAEIAAWDYWHSRGRSRSVESLLAATRRIEDHDRVDVAHLLPRLARALLHTFPPDFESLEEPAVENGVAAATFFAPDLDTRALLAGGFSAWLAAHAERVEGPRGFGDIVVFEDPEQTRWPFTLVQVADGLLFGRRPTLYGPWELLREEELPGLNPRLRSARVTVYRVRGPTPQRESDPAAPETPPIRLSELPAGPWGRLKYYELRLAPSTELLDSLPAPDPRPRWTFAGISVSRIRRLIDGLGLPEGLRSELRGLFADFRPDHRGPLTVYPAPALVRATPAAFREQLFPHLQAGVEATDYAQDLHIATRLPPEEWLPPGRLPERLRRAVLDLVYRRGGGLALADFGTLYHTTSDPAERRDLLQQVYGSPVLMVLLARPDPAEVPGLTEYWRIDQQKSVGRLLDSFAHSEEVVHLDLVHLLPPLAREMMNVFVRAPANAPTPSCYWTALNFAAERPDSRLLVTPRTPGREHEIAWRKLQEEYDSVGTPARLGDVIAYRRTVDGDLQHVCAYVAADVVYTKNGFGSSNPWCLMHLADVDALYLLPGATERLVFRPRLPGAPSDRP